MHLVTGPTVPISPGSAKVLVLGCIDPRYTAILNWFLSNYKKLKNNFDLFVLAGSSLGYNQSAGLSIGSGITYSNTSASPWHSVFDEHVDLALALHSITEIWVFDHMDCGAYAHFLGPLPETEALHTKSLITFCDTWSTDYHTKAFLIGTDSSISYVYSTTKENPFDSSPYVEPFEVLASDFNNFFNVFVILSFIIGLSVALMISTTKI